MSRIITDEDLKAVREYIMKGEAAMPFEKALAILDKLQRVEVVGHTWTLPDGQLSDSLTTFTSTSLFAKDDEIPLYAVKETP